MLSLTATTVGVLPIITLRYDYAYPWSRCCQGEACKIPLENPKAPEANLQRGYRSSCRLHHHRQSVAWLHLGEHISVLGLFLLLTAVPAASVSTLARATMGGELTRSWMYRER